MGLPDIHQVGERGQRVTVSWVYLTCIKLERGAKGDCVTSVPDMHQVGEREAKGDCVMGVPDMHQVGERGQRVTV